MLLHQFPDLQWLKKQADQRFKNRQGQGGRVLPNDGWPTVILNAETKSTYRDNIRGPLSLFTNIKGESSVSVPGRSVRVKEGFFYLSNPDQHYTLEIDQHKPIETFNIHFGEYFADQIFSAIRNKPEFLLDNDFQVPLEALSFHNRLQPKDEFITTLIQDIKTNGESDQLYREEKLVTLLSHLLRQESEISKMKNVIPALKASTREEIIQRLTFSIDYIYSNYDQNLSLDELARESCLSKFHFLRLFKIAYGQTPHQFVTAVRLQRAKELLRFTDLTVNEVSKTVGFDNASSFSRLFFNTMGVYPTQFQSAVA